MSEVLEALRKATAGTRYEGSVYLVGGIVRDKVMGLDRPEEDIDLVIEGDAVDVIAMPANLPRFCIPWVSPSTSP